MLKAVQTAFTDLRSDLRRDGRVDIHIVHTELEWQIARAIARKLDEHGYVVAPTKTLDLPHRPVVTSLPADARAVLVIWPLAHTEFGMPALALEARAAAQRGNLVQIYAGMARPAETYAGPPPIDFNGWDLASTRGPWRALLRHLRPLCGPPPTRPMDRNAVTQNAVLAGTMAVAVGGALFALSQAGHHDEFAAPAPPVTSPDAEEVRVAVRATAPKHTTVTEAAAKVTERPLEGGPDKYDEDLGVSPSETRAKPVEAAAAPPPAKRPKQGPEE